MKLLRKIRNRIIQWSSDCDGMCDFYDICRYCRIKENEDIDFNKTL